MKASYGYILENYVEFDENLLEVALEADATPISASTVAPTSAASNVEIKAAPTTASRVPEELKAKNAVKDTVKSVEKTEIDKTENVNKVIERVKKLIETISRIVSQVSRKISNNLRQMMVTDKGFKTLYYEKKSMIKPYPKIRLITYQYIPEVLDNAYTEIFKIAKECINKLALPTGTENSSGRVSEVITASKDSMLEVLFAPYTKDADQPVKNFQDFSKYIISKYRGEKKEFLYELSIVPKLEQICFSTSQINVVCSKNVNEITHAFNTIKRLESRIQRGADQESLKLITDNASRAAVLFNVCSAFTNLFFELRLEQALNSRLILKRFYQF